MPSGPTLLKLAGRLFNKLATFLIKPAFNEFGCRSTISFPFRSGMEGRISIGSRVYIGHHCWIEAMVAPNSGEDTVIVIGDDVSMSGFCTITSVSKVVIGRGALIARFVHISDHSHNTTSRDLWIKKQGVSKVGPVIIGEGAWIGHGAVICPGVTVGRNAVIGANSVVREDVPDFCVAAGCPARIVKRSLPTVDS